MSTAPVIPPQPFSLVDFLAGKATEQSAAFGDEFFTWHAAIRIARVLQLQPVKEEHFEPAPVLGLDGASGFQFE